MARASSLPPPLPTSPPSPPPPSAGLNHYCDSCHAIADLNARTYGTVLDWAPILARDAWRHCAGLGGCALGVPHPPHGTTWSLGCSQCLLEAESVRALKC